MGIVIMLNNYLHDFAVALLSANLIVLTLIYRASATPQFARHAEFAKDLYRRISPVIIGCWAVILGGGIVRTLAYRQYEWVDAAGHGQVDALIVKHILLVGLVVWGTLVQLRLRKKFRGAR